MIATLDAFGPISPAEAARIDDAIERAAQYERAGRALHDTYCPSKGEPWHVGHEAVDCLEAYWLEAQVAVDAALGVETWVGGSR